MAADQNQLQSRRHERQHGQQGEQQRREKRHEQQLDLRLALIILAILRNAKAGKLLATVKHTTEPRWSSIVAELADSARPVAVER